MGAKYQQADEPRHESSGQSQRTRTPKHARQARRRRTPEQCSAGEAEDAVGSTRIELVFDDTETAAIALDPATEPLALGLQVDGRYALVGAERIAAGRLEDLADADLADPELAGKATSAGPSGATTAEASVAAELRGHAVRTTSSGATAESIAT
jgi:hypothetical protein